MDLDINEIRKLTEKYEDDDVEITDVFSCIKSAASIGNYETTVIINSDENITRIVDFFTRQGYHITERGQFITISWDPRYAKSNLL